MVHHLISCYSDMDDISMKASRKSAGDFNELPLYNYLSYVIFHGTGGTMHNQENILFRHAIVGFYYIQLLVQVTVVLCVDT